MATSSNSTEEAQRIFQKALEDVINARQESGEELSEIVKAIQKEEGRPFCAELVGLLKGCIGSFQHHRKNQCREKMLSCFHKLRISTLPGTVAHSYYAREQLASL